MLAAVRRGRPAEWFANGFALLGLSVPNFWLGLMAILWLSVAIPLFPASGHVPFTEDPIANLHHMVLPALVLGTGLAAVIMRQTRSSMLEALGTDYIRTARAKGLQERSVVGVHALRNSLIVVVTIVGLQLGALISGAVVTERIFGLPGFGKLTVDSVFQRDYPGHPRRRARHRNGVHPHQPARRPSLLAHRSAHPSVGGGLVSTPPRHSLRSRRRRDPA